MAAAVLLSSCVKDTLYDTPHPDKGAVTISLTGHAASRLWEDCGDSRLVGTR